MTTEEQWIEGAQVAVKIAEALQPLLAAGAPGFAIGLSIFAKVIQAGVDNEPKAKALIERIKSGDIPTPEEMKQHMDEYEAAHLELQAAIDAKLAAMPE